MLDRILCWIIDFILCILEATNDDLNGLEKTK